MFSSKLIEPPVGIHEFKNDVLAAMQGGKCLYDFMTEKKNCSLYKNILKTK